MILRRGSFCRFRCSKNLIFQNINLKWQNLKKTLISGRVRRNFMEPVSCSFRIFNNIKNPLTHGWDFQPWRSQAERLIMRYVHRGEDLIQWEIVHMHSQDTSEVQSYTSRHKESGKLVIEQNNVGIEDFLKFATQKVINSFYGSTPWVFPNAPELLGAGGKPST